MKQVEADRLLHLHRIALRAVFPDIPDPDIAAAPEIVHILLLGCEQLLEPLGHHTIHRPIGAAAEFFGRSRRGGVIDHVFRELNWAVGLSLDRKGDLAEILAVDDLVSMRARGLHHMIDGACQAQAAFFGRMAQHNPPVLA